MISGKPITLGHGYSTLAWIPEDKGSWALPLRHERITSFETPISKAAFQLRQVCQHLKQRPISLWDSEYGCAKFVKLTAEVNADKLMRLRPNRCVFGAPPPYPGTGRPKKHGQKMKLSDHPMEIIRIQRQGKGISKKPAKPMWLAWIGLEKLSLESLWQHYLRRFAIEHWNRFLKQRLHWTKAKLGTTEKGQRWSDLMTIFTWQLWLAREIIEDNPLPWQKPQPKEKLTPGRIAQSIPGVLVAIGTPAKSPKPRGKSTGWETGKKRHKKPRYPVVKKTVTRKKKEQKEQKEQKEAA